MKIIRILTTLVLVFCCLAFAGCDIAPRIIKLEITAPEQFDIGAGETSDELGVRVTGTKDWTLSNINVIVGDPSILQVDFEKSIKSAMYISFRIRGMQTGSTTLSFETKDGRIKSNVMTVTVYQPFTSIEFADTSDVVLNGLTDEVELRFETKSGDEPVESPRNLKFVSEDPDVVSAVYAINADGENVCLVSPVSYGETYVYVQSFDGSIKSQRIKITVTVKDSSSDGNGSGDSTETPDFVLNVSTKKIHHPTCYTIKNMKPENRKEVNGTVDAYLADGYTYCNTCFK